MKKIFKIFISILSKLFLALSSIFKIKEKNFVILICSYNNEKYIYKNLLSAVNQNYKNFEIIYINDLSTDKTEELFYKFIKKYSYLNVNIKLINNKFRKGSLRNK